MKSFYFLVLLISFLIPNLSFSQATEVPPPWTHESEAGIVAISGNTESESYNFKQITTRHWGLDSLSGSGHYLETKAGSQITAKNWDARLRYDKSLSEIWYLYLAQKAEADPFAGYIQRDTSDVGAKYVIRKTEAMNWIAEGGFSYVKTYNTEHINKYDPSTRVFTQIDHTVKKDVTLRYSAEYLQSIKRSYVYFINSELSLSVMLNQQFSIKTGYLLKYQNDLVPPTTKYVDTTFTTSLVAHF